MTSHGTAFNWPAHPAHLNSLDFHFWGEALKEVCRKYPENIESLVDCVKSSFDASHNARSFDANEERFKVLLILILQAFFWPIKLLQNKTEKHTACSLIDHLIENQFELDPFNISLMN